MNQYEEKVFVFDKSPTGLEVFEVIGNNNLEDWTLVGVERIFNEPVHSMNIVLNKYRYELRFRRNT